MPVIEENKIDEVIDSNYNQDWVVVAYNNETNTFEEVINILIQATGRSRESAADATWEIHNFGKAVVYHNTMEECERVAKIISKIGITTEVYQE